MKKYLFFFCCFSLKIGISQDTIYLKGGEKIIAAKIVLKDSLYSFKYTTSTNQIIKTNLLQQLVDSVKLVSAEVKKASKKKRKKEAEIITNTTPVLTDSTNAVTQPKSKNWQFNFAIGLSVNNVLETNNPSGTDKKTIGGSFSFDMNWNYIKYTSKINFSNELHYIIAAQKNGFSSGNYLQRLTDNLTTLHDFSNALGKNKKWHFNLIVKTSTSIFTIYNGDFFKNYTGFGKIQGFASPYDITFSPGIKWQPTEAFRFSISPYSFNLYGVANNEIAQKGIFITDKDGAGNFKNFLFKRLGAELNVWYDKQIGKWLELQYRVGISANYFENITKNGLLDGLFINKFKLFKDIYLTHRATINGDFSITPFKPYYNQNILLSYNKSF